METDNPRPSGLKPYEYLFFDVPNMGIVCYYARHPDGIIFRDDDWTEYGVEQFLNGTEYIRTNDVQGYEVKDVEVEDLLVCDLKPIKKGRMILG